MPFKCLQALPKTIKVTDRVHKRESNHVILHQEDFEKLRREWNQLGLEGPFLEAGDWGPEPGTEAERWETADVPLFRHFSDLEDGGTYYVEGSGEWV